MNISELATIPQRLQDLEGTVANLADRLHDLEQDNDDEDSCESVYDLGSVCADNDNLKIANDILHAKVSMLRDRIAELEEEYADSVLPEETKLSLLNNKCDMLTTANLSMAGDIKALKAENQRLADICEERDKQIDYLETANEALVSIVERVYA